MVTKPSEDNMVATATILETTRIDQVSPPGPAESSLVEEPLYEVVGGQRVELPPMAASSNRVAGTLSFFMTDWARAEGLGRVSTEMLHRLDDSGELKRRPDVSFVSYSRWPRNKPVTDDEAWDVVPDLAVEVVSPSDKADDLLEKVEEYFNAGVLQVWVIYPRQRIVYVYESFTRIMVVSQGQHLEGGSILPGFKLPLATLFEDLQAKEGNVVEATS
jgi:Uma2 family endonuclease